MLDNQVEELLENLKNSLNCLQAVVTFVILISLIVGAIFFIVFFDYVDKNEIRKRKAEDERVKKLIEESKK